MAKNLYITDTTKTKLERLADAEKRTLDGEIHFLADLRIKELSLDSNDSTINLDCQGNK